MFIFYNHPCSVPTCTQADVVGCEADSSHTIHVKRGTKFPPGFKVTGGAKLACGNEELDLFAMSQLHTAAVKVHTLKFRELY